MNKVFVCHICKHSNYTCTDVCRLELKDSRQVIFIQHPTKEDFEYVASCGCSFVNGYLVKFNYDITSKWIIESIKLILLKLQGQKIYANLLQEHIKLSNLARPYYKDLSRLDENLLNDYMYSRNLIIDKSIKTYYNLMRLKIFMYLRYLGLYKDLIKLIITKYFIIIDRNPIDQFLLRVSPL